MTNVRIIARLDIKGPNLIKGVHLEGLRVMGDPEVFARKYYEDGVDELIYMDTVASLYGRNNLSEIVEQTARNVFVPITVGGGIRSTGDVRTILRAGADKVAINTAATKHPDLISEVARHFGSQCMVLSIEAKRMGPGKWVCYTDNGREQTNLDVVQWAKRGTELGAGEILLTSVDHEGTTEGFDIDLMRAVTNTATIPVIASGGMGTIEHLIRVIEEGGVSAVAAAHVLHYGIITVSQIRERALAQGLDVRSA